MLYLVVLCLSNLDDVSSVTIGVAVGVSVLFLVFIGAASYCILRRYKYEF